MLRAGFEPTIPPSERHQTHAWEGSANGIGHRILSENRNQDWNMLHAEKEENLQQLKGRRRWEDQEVDVKD